MKILLILIFIILLLHYIFFLIRILRGLGKLCVPSASRTPNCYISIIIPFRNESKNILHSLESIETLNFPPEKFEVIYIDDNSTDDSYNLVLTGRKKSNISLFKLPAEISNKGNKKNAIQFGVENSKGDIIVSTDADCIHQENWLINLLNCFDSETAFVSGPVDFIQGPGLFSRIQQLEFEGLILAGAGLIGNGKPVICNGANIAYKRHVFEEVDGFSDNLRLSSGDDEILMQKIAKKTTYKIRFCASKEAVVLTESNRNIREFFNQRRRWASKTLHYYDPGLIIMLGSIFLFYTGLLVQLMLIFLGYYILLATLVSSLVIKILLELSIIKKGEYLFSKKNRILTFLIAELFQTPYIIFSAISGLYGKFIWKGRNIRR